MRTEKQFRETAENVREALAAAIVTPYGPNLIPALVAVVLLADALKASAVGYASEYEFAIERRRKENLT